MIVSLKKRFWLSRFPRYHFATVAAGLEAPTNYWFEVGEGAIHLYPISISGEYGTRWTCPSVPPASGSFGPSQPSPFKETNRRA